MNLKCKFICSLLLSLTLIISSGTFAFADEVKPLNQRTDFKYFEDVYPENTEHINESIQLRGQFKGTYATKKNVTTTYEWSAGKRVSDDVKSGSKGGSIKATKSVSFSGSVSGEVYGITFSGATSMSTTTSYTLNLEPNKTQYMAYKVQYKVEKGTRQVHDMMTGKVISTNKYTVKRIDHGQYYLVILR